MEWLQFKTKWKCQGKHKNIFEQGTATDIKKAALFSNYIYTTVLPKAVFTHQTANRIRKG